MERSSQRQLQPSTEAIDLAGAGERLVMGGCAGGAALGGLWGIVITRSGGPGSLGLVEFAGMVGVVAGAFLGVIAQVVTAAALAVQQRACRRTTHTRLRVTAIIVPAVAALLVMASFLTSPPGSVLARAGLLGVMAIPVTVVAWATATCSLRHHDKPLPCGG